jgi:hypothetical protein
MKESFINGDRTIVANDQSAKVAEPSQGAFYFPAPSVTAQRAAVLPTRLATVPAVRCDQLDASCRQPIAEGVAIIGTIGNHPLSFLAWPPTAIAPRYPDRSKRFFREPRFVRGCRVKLLSQRKTLAVDHHHPLRTLAPLGFPDFRAPFLAGAKLPSRNDSLQFSCSRSLSSARNARQMVSQTPCSSQSRSRRQQVAGDGNSSGRSCQRAPLRKIQRMPSRTLRSFAGGRPPRRDLRIRGNRGQIFSHWASVSSRPYRAIGPPLALLFRVIAHFQQGKHHYFSRLSPVLKQALATASVDAITLRSGRSARQTVLPDACQVCRF